MAGITSLDPNSEEIAGTRVRLAFHLESPIIQGLELDRSSFANNDRTTMHLANSILRIRENHQAGRTALAILVVGVISVIWLANTPGGLLGKADAVGYAVCHRIDLRSFHLGGRQVPLCVRCTGMYLGAMLGLAYQALIGGRRAGFPSRGITVFLGLLALAFLVDGLNSFFGLLPLAPPLYSPGHGGRLLTGTGMGVVMAALVFPVFNQTVWAQVDSRPALAGWRNLAGLLSLALILDLLVATENPLVLYPLALISAAGVLVILTLIYAMVWLSVVRAENRFQSWRDLIRPLAAGFGTALLQVALLDLGRYWLTGTWGGFALG